MVIVLKVFVTKENANVCQIMNMPKIAHTMDVSKHYFHFGYRVYTGSLQNLLDLIMKVNILTVNLHILQT